MSKKFTDLNARIILANFDNPNPSHVDKQNVLDAWKSVEWQKPPAQQTGEFKLYVEYILLSAEARKIIQEHEKQFLIENVSFTHN